MTHDELLAEIDRLDAVLTDSYGMSALRAVVELHKPMWDGEYCKECHPDQNGSYPCPTIQAIEKELG